MRNVRFGGPNLPEGKVTFFYWRNPDGTFGGEVKAKVGDVVPENRIGGTGIKAKDGSLSDAPTAEHFVSRGLAEFVEADQTVSDDGAWGVVCSRHAGNRAGVEELGHGGQ